MSGNKKFKYMKFGRDYDYEVANFEGFSFEDISAAKSLKNVNFDICVLDSSEVSMGKLIPDPQIKQEYNIVHPSVAPCEKSSSIDNEPQYKLVSKGTKFGGPCLTCTDGHEYYFKKEYREDRQHLAFTYVCIHRPKKGKVCTAIVRERIKDGLLTYERNKVPHNHTKDSGVNTATARQLIADLKEQAKKDPFVPCSALYEKKIKEISVDVLAKMKSLPSQNNLVKRMQHAKRHDTPTAPKDLTFELNTSFKKNSVHIPEAEIECKMFNCQECLRNYTDDGLDTVMPILLDCGHDICRDCAKKLLCDIGVLCCPDKSCQKKHERYPLDSLPVIWSLIKRNQKNLTSGLAHPSVNNKAQRGSLRNIRFRHESKSDMSDEVISNQDVSMEYSGSSDLSEFGSEENEMTSSILRAVGLRYKHFS